MNKKPIFTLPIIKVETRDPRHCVYCTNLLSALKTMMRNGQNKLETYAVFHFYSDGFKKVLLPEEERRYIFFGTGLTYEESVEIIKKNKNIHIPTNFLYDTKRYENEMYLYSERLNSLTVFSSEVALYIDDEIAQMILMGPLEYTPFHIQCMEDGQKELLNNISMYSDRKFFLGNHWFTFGECYSFEDAYREFVNHSEDYIFLQIYDFKYRFDGSTFKSGQPILIFMEDQRLSYSEALMLTKDKTQLKKFKKAGFIDFVYNKKREMVLPLPKENVFFVPRETILHKWNIY